jgi:hypothetical protein
MIILLKKTIVLWSPKFRFEVSSLDIASSIHCTSSCTFVINVCVSQSNLRLHFSFCTNVSHQIYLRFFNLIVLSTLVEKYTPRNSCVLHFFHVPVHLSLVDPYIPLGSWFACTDLLRATECTDRHLDIIILRRFRTGSEHI